MNITTLSIMVVIGVGTMWGLSNFYITQLNTYAVSPTNSQAVAQYSLFNATMLGMAQNANQMQGQVQGVLNGGTNFIAGIADSISLFFGLGKFLFYIPSMISNFIGLMLASFGLNGITVPPWVGIVISLVVIIIITMQVIRLFARMYAEI